MITRITVTSRAARVIAAALLLFAASVPSLAPTPSLRRRPAQDALRQDHAPLLKDIAEGRALGDTTTLADRGVVSRLKGEYEAREG
jgi:hypothetical protein